MAGTGRFCSDSLCWKEQRLPANRDSLWTAGRIAGLIKARPSESRESLIPGPRPHPSRRLGRGETHNQQPQGKHNAP